MTKTSRKKARTGDEIINPRRGRKPGKLGVEKRMEQALTGTTPQKKVGRKKFTYDDRPEHIRYILDSCAMGYSAHRIVCLLKERYGEHGDEVVTPSTIISYRKRYAGEIKERELSLRAEIAGMLPSHRMRILQQIIDESMDGEPFLDKEGNVYHKKNFQAATQAIKEMNAMQREIAAEKPADTPEDRLSQEIAEQKEIIREFMVAQMKATGLSEEEVLKSMVSDLGKDYEDAIGELASEYKM